MVDLGVDGQWLSIGSLSIILCIHSDFDCGPLLDHCGLTGFHCGLTLGTIHMQWCKLTCRFLSFLLLCHIWNTDYEVPTKCLVFRVYNVSKSTLRMLSESVSLCFSSPQITSLRILSCPLSIFSFRLLFSCTNILPHTVQYLDKWHADRMTWTLAAREHCSPFALLSHTL